MSLTNTISFVEVIWTLVSVIGCFYISKLFFKAAGDWVDLKLRRINSIREFAARAVVVTYSAYLFVESGFMVAGIFAMTQPATPFGSHTTPVGYAMTIDFMAISFVLAACAFILERWRQSLIKKISEIDDLDWYYQQKDKEEGVDRHGE